MPWDFLHTQLHVLCETFYFSFFLPSLIAGFFLPHLPWLGLQLEHASWNTDTRVPRPPIVTPAQAPGTCRGPGPAPDAVAPAQPFWIEVVRAVSPVADAVGQPLPPLRAQFPAGCLRGLWSGQGPFVIPRLLSISVINRGGVLPNYYYFLHWLTGLYKCSPLLMQWIILIDVLMLKSALHSWGPRSWDMIDFICIYIARCNELPFS